MLSKSRRLTVLATISLLAAPAANGQQRYASLVDRILDAWKTAAVVCLGEDHGRYYDSELRIALVQHPAFPRTVRVIVVEMANPIHQDLLDRFILDGAAMSREELAPLWRDATGYDVWESPIYEKFLRAVREVNLRIPHEERVRVLAGDGRVDWPNITRPEELLPLMNRGGNIRNIIAEQILDRRLKALAIYGAGHCSKLGGGFPGDLAGRYASERMWSITPLIGDAGAAKGRSTFGFGDEPAYVVITGSKWMSTPAADLATPAYDRSDLGQITDAIVYHGAVPDSVVRSDLTTLNAKLGPELERRERLRKEAVELRLKRE